MVLKWLAKIKQEKAKMEKLYKNTTLPQFNPRVIYNLGTYLHPETLAMKSTQLSQSAHNLCPKI